MTDLPSIDEWWLMVHKRARSSANDHDETRPATLEDLRVVLESMGLTIAARIRKYDIDGPGGLPIDPEGWFLPCPLCDRVSCDHTPAERPDSWDNTRRSLP